MYWTVILFAFIISIATIVQAYKNKNYLLLGIGCLQLTLCVGLPIYRIQYKFHIIGHILLFGLVYCSGRIITNRNVSNKMDIFN